MITGFSKWWDHPVIESRACRITTSEEGEALGECLRGESPAPGRPLRLLLAPGTSIHDYVFRVRWQETGRMQEAETRVGRDVRPTAVKLR